ncbi:MAG TPA: serine hydrolase domain-containing protein, partial [Burkholderiales bacterium]|nr:serine hydrolase domain-containing protein [Burkholderiales bacterium]
MPTRRLAFSVLALMLFASATCAAEKSLDGMLAPYVARYELPALAAAAVKRGVIVASGAAGVRRHGGDVRATVDDRFHIGSDTKAMTALLCGMYVEAGRLRWSSTVAEVFPELADMDAGLRAVTLEQLLSHTGGVAGDNEMLGDLLGKVMSQPGNLDELRYWLVREWSRQPLQSPPGTRFQYSNMGYTIAGAMLERVSGKTWEELVTERVFVPLGLKSAGLGPQSSVGKIDAPLPHAIVDGRIKPLLAGPNADNPLVIGPAGLAHLSARDFARWAGWNAGEGKRGPPLVTHATLRKLHTPVIEMPVKDDAAPGTPSHGGYGLGWGQLRVSWAPRPLAYHGGSNGYNLAH